MQAKAGEDDEKAEETEKPEVTVVPVAAESAKKTEVTVTDNYIAEDEVCAAIGDDDDPFVKELKEECEQEVLAAKKEKEDYWEEQLNKVEKGIAELPEEAAKESTEAEPMVVASTASSPDAKKAAAEKKDVLEKDVKIDDAP